MCSLVATGAFPAGIRENFDPTADRCAAAELIVEEILDRHSYLNSDRAIVFRTDDDEEFWYDRRPGKLNFQSDDTKASWLSLIQEEIAAYMQMPWAKFTEAPPYFKVGEFPTSFTDKVLLQSLYDHDPGNAVATCATIRDLLRQKGVTFGDAAVAAIERPEDTAILEYVELPVVSSDGLTALVYESAYGGELIKMHRGQDGHWMIVGRMTLWLI